MVSEAGPFMWICSRGCAGIAEAEMRNNGTSHLVIIKYILLDRKEKAHLDDGLCVFNPSGGRDTGNPQEEQKFP
jgi:hypothetical protein